MFINNFQQVVPLMRPSPCGGGYTQNDITFTIPTNFAGCTSPAEGCAIQIYAHSVEPRTYAMCMDVTLTAAAANTTATAPGGFGVQGALTKRAAAGGKLVDNPIPQPAIHYSDSFDTAHIDSTRSGYRGQQLQYLDPEVKAAIDLYSYIPNGGLLPTGQFNAAAIDAIDGKVANAIAKAEQAAIAKAKAAQAQLNAVAQQTGQARECVEGAEYGVVQNANCNRQFTTTYVTEVGYQALLAQFKPQYEAAGLTPYTPTTKDAKYALVTLPDPKGSMANANGDRIIPTAAQLANAQKAADAKAAQLQSAYESKLAAAKLTA